MLDQISEMNVGIPVSNFPAHLAGNVERKCLCIKLDERVALRHSVAIDNDVVVCAMPDGQFLIGSQPSFPNLGAVFYLERKM